MRSTRPTDSNRRATLHAMCVAALIALLSITLVGCKSSPGPEADIPLPGFADEGPKRPTGVYAVIRRVDMPLDVSTDDAWSIINEQLVPPVTRGTWRGNGLRIGLLPREQLDAYSEAMPQPSAFSRVLMNKSPHPVPIAETPRLRGDVRFQIDLTRPPRPRLVETIKGGEGSTLRLLANIETGPDGQHTLVLTPQHHIPSPLNLIPRDPLERELDGRIFEELTLRVTPGKHHIAVVGLHWPWPMGEVYDDDNPDAAASEVDQVMLSRSTSVPAADANDPAAPPRHLTPIEDNTENETESMDAPDSPGEPIDTNIKPRQDRIAPPLATSFGSTLFTGTRIRQPVRTVLLITIEEPEPEAPAQPED